mgnify:CR=1 FL=1
MEPTQADQPDTSSANQDEAKAKKDAEKIVQQQQLLEMQKQEQLIAQQEQERVSILVQN